MVIIIIIMHATKLARFAKGAWRRRPTEE